jgi:hypothetical protein
MQFPVEGATFQDRRPAPPEDRAEALPDGGPFRCVSFQGAGGAYRLCAFAKPELDPAKERSPWR